MTCTSASQGPRMTETAVTHRVSTEGADLLTLAGVNDANLVELARLSGAKVALRGDALSITGAGDQVDRAAAVATRMIESARQRSPVTPDDVMRMHSEDWQPSSGALSTPDVTRIALPAFAKSFSRKRQARPSTSRKSPRTTSWSA